MSSNPPPAGVSSEVADQNGTTTAPLFPKWVWESGEHTHLKERFVSLKNETRAAALAEFLGKLDSGEYRTQSSPCICGTHDDLLISQIDRYGIPLDTVLCRKCGLMRSDPYYTPETLESFYKNEYRPLYSGGAESTDKFFEDQQGAGREILSYVGSGLPGRAVVLEVGAGAGGILEPFAAAGHEVHGCDFGAEYIRYGRNLGLDLHEGDMTVLESFPKADLLILNHLLEHIPDPVSFLEKARSLLKPDGLLFIGVPGLILYPVKYRSKLLYYLQNAHAWHFCLETLRFTASRAGFRLVSGDERIFALFRQDGVAMAPPPGVSDLLIGIFTKAQILADRQISSDSRNRKLSTRAAEHATSLRRVRIALKKSRFRVDEQETRLQGLRDAILRRDREQEETRAALDRARVALIRTKADLNTSKRELEKIKTSWSWKIVRVLRKTSSLLGLTAVYNHAIRKPFIFLTRKRHWHTLFRLMPVDDRMILFESHRGLSVADSPKAICQAIIARGLPVRCVWSVENPGLVVPAGVEKVERFSARYYHHIARARVLIQNGEFAQALPVRKDQVYINTQHGTPLKLMGSDILHKKPNIDATSYTKDGRWNWLITANAYSTEIFRRVFSYSGPVLECGYPRNDLFRRRNTPEDIITLKRDYGLPPDKKILLYAPTWRDVGSSRTDRNFKLQLDLARLHAEFGESHVIILRLHHLIVSSLTIDMAFSRFAFECSSAGYDIQELMLVSDILITDYSSVMFDFANLSRPMIFFAYDLENYSSEIRGTYFDLEEQAPGPVVKTMDDLVTAIRDVGTSLPIYQEKRAAFHAKFCSLEQGDASDRVIDEIIIPAMNLK
jgi:CDP-glycerol glycerophosphotransferase (TagB/SpsB family)/2-polyprenyl-3-methyl-5-hydroxy-6-metoxy-1,4-benzoquinol methylase